MSNIKVRKEMLVVELKDGTILYTDNSLEQLQSILEASQFVNIDGMLFNKFEFKRAYRQDVDNVKLYIAGLSYQDKLIIEKREEKMNELGKKRENAKQVQKFLDHHHNQGQEN